MLVAAIRSPAGASMALLDLALSGKFEALVSTALVLEYEAVLTRDEHLRVSELMVTDVERTLDAICRTAIEVKIRWHWRPQLHDQNDEMVLEAAINGHAEAIITFNRADFEGGAKRFGIAVISPSEALERVELQ